MEAQIITGTRVCQAICRSVCRNPFQVLHFNKPNGINHMFYPFTQDVYLLHKFLATERAKCMKDLEEEPNIKSFGNLAQVTLTQVVLFNRRRQREVSKECVLVCTPMCAKFCQIQRL